LASKDIGTAASAPVAKGDGATPNVFSKVFTPVAKEEIKQPSEHSSKPAGHVFQAARENGALKPSSTKFPFLGDAQAPFKVFSRPPEKLSVFSKPGGVTPFVDGVSSTASALSSRTPLGTFVPRRTGSEKAQVLSEDEEDQNNEDTPPNAAVDYEDTDEYEASHNTPFGGRFGQFNVMTPITERTLEYTSTGRFSIPDGDVSTLVERATFGEPDAVVAAERLAAEVRRDNVFVSEQHADSRVRNTRSDEATSASSFDPPFRLSDGHTILGRDKAEKDSRLQAITALVEEKTGTLDLSDEAPAFKPTNPCNPFDPSIISTLLSQLPPDPEHHHSSHSSQLLDDLQKFARKQLKANRTSSATSRGQTFPLELGDKRFCVYEKLGEGGFGAVFAAKVVAAQFGGDDDDEEEDEDDESHRVAIKVVKPHNIWEFRMLHKAHECLPTRLRSSVIHPQALYTFRDESFLVLDLCTQGSLLDIINHAGPAGVSQQGGCLDELLVMFFTIEFLRLLEGLHGAGIIHGDLKIDNCLVRLEDVPGGASLWAAQYDPTGAGGWHCKGIKLIDFGRAIDTRMFPHGQAFLAEWATDARDCVEMREGRPWTYQADYFGLAGIVYCMLYGKYIEASSVVLSAPPPESGEGVPRYKLAMGFKRYWQTDLWTRLFDVLLNPCLVRPDGALPLSDTLTLLRAEMEEWLQVNCKRSTITLMGLLKKVELFVIHGH
jgi:checkpoint serine/threonine-protein kinase